MRDTKENLEQEADFWRTMLKQYPDAGTSEYQRMHVALLLAEYKLAQMTAIDCDLNRSNLQIASDFSLITKT